MENAYRKSRIEALKFIFWGLCSEGLYINNSSQEELIYVSKTHWFLSVIKWSQFYIFYFSCPLTQNIDLIVQYIDL